MSKPKEMTSTEFENFLTDYSEDVSTQGINWTQASNISKYFQIKFPHGIKLVEKKNHVK